MERLHHLDRLDSLHLKNTGIYEPAETKLVQEHLKRGDVFVDVGAHIGYFTVMAGRLVGDRGKVFAFEPTTENYALLHGNICESGLQNCYNYPYAVGAFKGQTTMFLSELNTGDHRGFITPDREHERVDMVTLDGFAPFRDITVDFMKIDVQGMESAVLKGAYFTIKRSPAMRMIIECDAALLEQAGSSREELISLLVELGFVICVKADGEWFPMAAEKLNRRHKRGHMNLYCAKVAG